MLRFMDSMVELITQTSTNLPPDVRGAMAAAVEKEQTPSQSSQALAVIATNIDEAYEDQGPICQDTGMPTFKFKTPIGANQIKMKLWIQEAIAETTRQGKLRPNTKRPGRATPSLQAPLATSAVPSAPPLPLRLHLAARISRWPRRLLLRAYARLLRVPLCRKGLRTEEALVAFRGDVLPHVHFDRGQTVKC